MTAPTAGPIDLQAARETLLRNGHANASAAASHFVEAAFFLGHVSHLAQLVPLPYTDPDLWFTGTTPKLSFTEADLENKITQLLKMLGEAKQVYEAAADILLAASGGVSTNSEAST